MNQKRQYSKEGKDTIKVVFEAEQTYPIDALLKGRKQVEAQIEQLNKQLKEIDNLIEEAKKLGIELPKE